MSASLFYPQPWPKTILYGVASSLEDTTSVGHCALAFSDFRAPAQSILFESLDLDGPSARTLLQLMMHNSDIRSHVTHVSLRTSGTQANQDTINIFELLLRTLKSPKSITLNIKSSEDSPINYASLVDTIRSHTLSQNFCHVDIEVHGRDYMDFLVMPKLRRLISIDPNRQCGSLYGPTRYSLEDQVVIDTLDIRSSSEQYRPFFPSHIKPPLVQALKMGSPFAQDHNWMKSFVDPVWPIVGEFTYSPCQREVEDWFITCWLDLKMLRNLDLLVLWFTPGIFDWCDIEICLIWARRVLNSAGRAKYIDTVQLHLPHHSGQSDGSRRHTIGLLDHLFSSDDSPIVQNLSVTFWKRQADRRQGAALAKDDFPTLISNKMNVVITYESSGSGDDSSESDYSDDSSVSNDN